MADKTETAADLEELKRNTSVSPEYLKEKMRERAETEVPQTDEPRSESLEQSLLADTLEETKEAVEKVAEKLEELSDKVEKSEQKDALASKNA